MHNIKLNQFGNKLCVCIVMNGKVIVNILVSFFLTPCTNLCVCAPNLSQVLYLSRNYVLITDIKDQQDFLTNNLVGFQYRDIKVFQSGLGSLMTLVQHQYQTEVRWGFKRRSPSTYNQRSCPYSLTSYMAGIEPKEDVKLNESSILTNKTQDQFKYSYCQIMINYSPLSTAK